MAFTDIEKINIKRKLMISCEDSWSKFGYKKTNIDDLCTKSGISKGAFYLFYPSKEDLFFDVIMNIQARLIDLVRKSLGDNPTKKDLADTLKLVYREYIRIPFIFETNSPDFIKFMNKLPEKKVNELNFHGSYDIKSIIRSTNLRYKVVEDMGNSTLGIIFTPDINREDLPWNHLEVIDFMIDTMIDAVFV